MINELLFDILQPAKIANSSINNKIQREYCKIIFP